MARTKGFDRVGLRLTMGSGSSRKRLFKQLLKLARIESVDYVGDRSLFFSLLSGFGCLQLFRLEFLKLIFELTPSNFEPGCDLWQEFIAIFDSGSDVAWAVLKFALTLKVERVQ